MRRIWTFVAALILSLPMVSAEDVTKLSGTWLIDLKHIRGYPAASLPSSDSGFRRIDPGIGWPPSKGPTGEPTQEDVVARLLRGGVQNLKLLIVQTDHEVQVTRTFSMAGKEQTIIQKFTLDGTQRHNPGSNGQGEFISKSIWNNGVLTNVGQKTDHGYSIVLREEYSISKDGKKLQIETSGYSAGTDPDSLVTGAPKPIETVILPFNRK